MPFPSQTESLVNGNLQLKLNNKQSDEMLDLGEEKKLKDPEQRVENQQIQLTHQVASTKSNLGHISGRQELSPILLCRSITKTPIMINKINSHSVIMAFQAI